MKTWEDYKKQVREKYPEVATDIDEAEAVSSIVGAMIEQRHKLKISQRELAAMCGLPHSSVARIESGKSSPNLTTLVNILNHLGLSLTVERF